MNIYWRKSKCTFNVSLVFLATRSNQRSAIIYGEIAIGQQSQIGSYWLLKIFSFFAIDFICFYNCWTNEKYLILGSILIYVVETKHFYEKMNKNLIVKKFFMRIFKFWLISKKLYCSKRLEIINLNK